MPIPQHRTGVATVRQLVRKLTKIYGKYSLSINHWVRTEYKDSPEEQKFLLGFLQSLVKLNDIVNRYPVPPAEKEESEET
ncbi:hypothetical protein ANRL4_01576 [Anaerolineae bacterium]|nr:hypothetical protein ANRL4_01576 [Anaerolineae bacterium]